MPGFLTEEEQKLLDFYEEHFSTLGLKSKSKPVEPEIIENVLQEHQKTLSKSEETTAKEQEVLDKKIEKLQEYKILFILNRNRQTIQQEQEQNAEEALVLQDSTGREVTIAFSSRQQDANQQLPANTAFLLPKPTPMRSAGGKHVAVDDPEAQKLADKVSREMTTKTADQFAKENKNLNLVQNRVGQQSFFTTTQKLDKDDKLKLQKDFLTQLALNLKATLIKLAVGQKDQQQKGAVSSTAPKPCSTKLAPPGSIR